MSQPRMDGCLHVTCSRGVRAALGLHGRLPPCGDTPGLCASREDTAQCSRTGKRLRPAAGGAQLPPQTALSEDGYDADVKKPVADPNRWKIPSGKVWVTSKLQVTRSPCTFPLDPVFVSDMVSPPGGGELEGEVKRLEAEARCAAHDVARREVPVAVDDELDRLPVAGRWEREAVLGVDRVGGGALGKGRQHHDPQGKRHVETS